MNSTLLQQYDQIGRQYIEGQKAYFSTKPKWSQEVFKRYFPSLVGKQVLDAGCGGGSDFSFLHELGATIFGIDPSRVMIDEAKKHAPNPESTVLGEFENIPFRDASFDLIHSRFALHYLNSFDRAYTEMHRVLQPRAGLFLVVSHPLFDQMYLQEKGHRDADLVTVDLYNNGTFVSFPPHHFGNYFTKTFFSLFDLRAVEEFREEELNNNPRKIPAALIFYAVKR